MQRFLVDIEGATDLLPTLGMFGCGPLLSLSEAMTLASHMLSSSVPWLWSNTLPHYLLGRGAYCKCLWIPHNQVIVFVVHLQWSWSLTEANTLPRSTLKFCLVCLTLTLTRVYVTWMTGSHNSSLLSQLFTASHCKLWWTEEYIVNRGDTGEGLTLPISI